MPKFDLNRVDYNWVAKTNNLKDLRAAYEELEYDGCFPDLMKTVGIKMAELDPAFARKLAGANKKLSAEEEKEIKSDLFSFLDTMNSLDNDLKNLGNEDQENQSIFSNNNG